MSVSFMTIASGSSGNSALFSCKNTRVLIDAGLSAAAIERGLKAEGISPADINALFVSHEHSDHTRGVDVLARRHGWPVYMTKGTWSAARGLNLPQSQQMLMRPGYGIRIDNIEVLPFDIPHDAAEPVGFCLFANDVKVSIATDLGHVSNSVLNHIQNSHILLIEANHDLDMLRHGRYPMALKRRILSPQGHLDNVSCGQMIQRAITRNTRHVLLGHLSQENNSPQLAFDTVSAILQSDDIELRVAPRATTMKIIF